MAKKYQIFELHYLDNLSTLRTPYELAIISDESSDKAKSVLEKELIKYKPEIFLVKDTEFLTDKKGIIYLIKPPE